VNDKSARGARAITVVGIGGSVALGSKSRSALVAALEGAAVAGADTVLFDLHVLDLPMFSPKLLDDPPPTAMELADAAFGADGLLWSSPMYHGTVSGAFKNALDWLYLLGDRQPPYLTDKVIGLMSTAGGTQGLQAVNTMEFIVRSLRAWAVPLVVPVGPATRLFDADGTLQDEGARRQLTTLGSEVTRVARLFVAGRLAELEAECAEAAQRVAAAA
jgi:FMN reductase